MKAFKTSTFLILVMSLIMTACQKDEQLEDQECPVSNEVFEITYPDLLNCKYISGTYWVYIDSVNLLTDSCYIDSAYAGTIASGTCNNSFENYTIETITDPSMEMERYAMVQGGIFKGVSGPNTGTLIYSDFETTQTQLNYVVNKLDSAFVYDQYYYNVLEVTVGNDASEQNDSSVYFVNSDFGVLRHSIYQNAALTSERVLKSKNIVR